MSGGGAGSRRGRLGRGRAPTRQCVVARATVRWARHVLAGTNRWQMSAQVLSAKGAGDGDGDGRAHDGAGWLLAGLVRPAVPEDAQLMGRPRGRRYSSRSAPRREAMAAMVRCRAPRGEACRCGRRWRIDDVWRWRRVETYPTLNSGLYLFPVQPLELQPWPIEINLGIQCFSMN